MSMREVYHETLKHIEKKFGKEHLPDEATRIRQERQIYEIGDQPFNFRGQKWKEGAADTLGELKERKDYTLCLLTCYDEVVWVDKSAFLGVDKYFHKVEVIPNKKTRDDFIRISGFDEVSGNNTVFYSIGNGVSDILPAFEVSERWRGILIPDRSTSPVFEKELGHDIYASVTIDNERMITLESISQLKNLGFENFKLDDKPV